MAYSSSTNHAQAKKLCELCDENNIKWRCIDCDMCLCEKCKTFHLKVPVTSKHQIVTIDTPIQDVQRRMVTDNIPCKDHVTKMNCLYCKTCNSLVCTECDYKDHVTQMNCLYCKTCDCLVCTECVSTSHTKHEFIQLETALDDKLKQLNRMHSKVVDKLKYCDIRSLEIQTNVPKCFSNFDNSVTEIKQREKELKNAIEKSSKALQKKVQLEKSKLKILVAKIEQQVNGARKELEHMMDELETALLSNQGKIIFDINFIDTVLKLDFLPLTVQNFIPTVETKNTIDDLFGSFQEETLLQSGLEFEVVRTYTTDLPTMQRAISIDETSAWISCKSQEKSVMRKVSVQGKKLKKSHEIPLAVNDMSLLSDDELLLTFENRSDVMLLTKYGELKPFLSVAPLLTLGIHVTRDNDIIVGVKERGNIFFTTDTDKSTRAIFVFDIGGRLKFRYQYDRNREIQLNNPYRITTNNNNDILVVDRKCFNMPCFEADRIVTLDREGKLRWTYEGNPENNFFQMFCGIATTSVGHIIISESSSHALHVLSKDGYILACKFMNDLGILRPWALSTDRDDRLWVGCGAHGQPSRAKLHILKLLL